MESKRTPAGAARAFVALAASHDGDSCLLWPYAKGHNGYGHIKLDGRLTTAHRAVLIQSAGPPPASGMHAAHAPLICHNRACVNPGHLRWATREDNTADRAVDGTDRNGGVPGEANSSAKLTEAQVIAIRADPRNQPTVAAEYGVSRSTIGHIRTGRTWASLNETKEQPPR